MGKRLYLESSKSNILRKRITSKRNKNKKIIKTRILLLKIVLLNPLEIGNFKWENFNEFHIFSRKGDREWILKQQLRD